MTAPTHRYVTLDGTEIHYTEWGDPDATPLVCVHGLSRHGRDFDPLAAALADEYRVLCPDMPGRGESEWDPDQYDGASLSAIIVGFFEELGLTDAHYLGLSMGGQLGIGVVAGPLADRVRRLVLVDIGPDPDDDDTADEGVQRIIDYLTNPPAFDEQRPPVKGETLVQFVRPVKLMFDACIGPVLKYTRLSGLNGSTSKGTRSWASRVATPRPPT